MFEQGTSYKTVFQRYGVRISRYILHFVGGCYTKCDSCEVDHRKYSESQPIRNTVHCKCGWAGVGIDTKVNLPKDSTKPRCPQCKKDNQLDWGKYAASVQKELNA